jgi:anti-sigma factor ChrR (cupin superfamily)
MLTCKDVTRIVASEGLEDLGWARRAEVRLHLLWCRHCRRYRARIEALGRAARSVFETDRPDADLDRLERSILDTLPDRSDRRDG